MDIFLILTVIILSFAVSLFLIRRWLKAPQSPDPLLTDWLKTSTGQINQRLDSATQMMTSVQKSLGEMSEVGRGIKSLQEFLSSPKLRGGLGEKILEDMIGESFPKHSFHFQYSFKSGVKVDAALKTDAGWLCIDSKFPMSNYNLMMTGDLEARKLFISDVKRHIDTISKKYILPDENTCDFALMFVPSESVYYEVVNISEISEFARNQRVYPVSPTTFYAHLQVLMLSFQGKDLEAKSREVFKLLRAIHKDYSKLEENLSVLNRHLTNAFNQMNQVNTGFTVLGQKLDSTQHLDLPQDDKIKQIES